MSGPIADGSDFPLSNLPYGSFSTPSLARRVGVAVGDAVLDVAAVLDVDEIRGPTIDTLMAAGPARWHEVRARLQDLLASDAARTKVEPHLHPLDTVRL